MPAAIGSASEALHSTASAADELTALIEPLATMKSLCRRRALTAPAMQGIIVLSGLAALAVLLLTGNVVVPTAIVASALVVMIERMRSESRLDQHAAYGWLARAIEIRGMTEYGRERLTVLLLLPRPSMDQALRWARAELRRQRRARMRITFAPRSGRPPLRRRGYSEER